MVSHRIARIARAYGRALVMTLAPTAILLGPPMCVLKRLEGACMIAPSRRTSLTAETIAQAAVMWRDETGTEACPSVDTLVRDQALDGEPHEDAWHRPFAIGCSGPFVCVVSAGGDGEHRTSDDLSQCRE